MATLTPPIIEITGLKLAYPQPGGGETVVLEPGGYHIMLMGLTKPLTEGEMVPATLIFEHAGRIEVEFMVDPPGGMDHSTMDHSAMGHSAGD